MMEEIRRIQLEVLNEIKRIAKKHQISYFLDGGTLLGAIVYGGYGPYDDDIDIGMVRNDYERFFEICKKELHPAFYVDEARLNDDYHLVFMKVKKKGTTYLEKNGWSSEVFVDIFPYDFISDNLLEFKVKKFIARQLKTIIIIKKVPVLRKKRWLLIKTLFFRRNSYYQQEYRKWVEYKK
ncbi:licD family protein [Listeria fleischmannii subsp. fleischmannii LU2006-1]|nr:licD family protein [Listeria fleischmannii subsp. fleischmannii LU2006-1]